ncbi:MAG: DoxX family protein [Actinomycetota bacterium]|jgi:uncharacterized membrane protein YphA (DoxX/SURF4 family)|nr:DoxX family protein [Actinomycetota bacterium]
MKSALIIVASILALAVLASAGGKLRKVPRVVESMTHVGVGEHQMVLLAVLEVAGGAGLLVGFAVTLLGRLASAGLVLYFLGAVSAHVRVRDEAKALAPAATLLTLAVATLVLEVLR